MPSLRITKEFRFEGAHALVGYDGKCRHIHGHSYLLYVTVGGKPCDCPSSPKYGMLMDFTDLKRIVTENIIDIFDHALILESGSALTEEMKRCYGNVVTLPFRPTAENLAAHFARIIGGKLPENVSLHSIKLYETPTSYVEWVAGDC